MSTSNRNPRGNEAVAAFFEQAKRYEKGTGGTTRYVARKLMAMSPPFTAESKVLDNACGTGIVIDEIQAHLSSSTSESSFKLPVIAADAAAPMIDILKLKLKHAEDTASWPNIGSVSAHTTTAENLDSSVVPDNSITHSYMNFGIFFCSDPQKAAEQVYRSLASGGTAIITSWHDLGYFNAISKTEKTCNPNGQNFRMPWNPGWNDPDYIKDVLVRAGFEKSKLKVVQEESFMKFDTASEISANFAEGFRPLIRPNGWADDEAKSKWIETLDKIMKEEGTLIAGDDDSVSIRMIANIALGTK